MYKKGFFTNLCLFFVGISFYISLVNTAAVPSTRYYKFSQTLSTNKVTDSLNSGNTNYDVTLAGNARNTNWGIPMAASRAKTDTTSVGHFTKNSFTISGWYYSCATTLYTAFCKKDSSKSPQEIYLCLEVDNDSNFIIQIRLTGKQYSQQINGFKAQTGWTWFAITVSDTFQIATITFYASNELYTGLTAAAPFKSEQFVLNGLFGTSTIPDPLAATNVLSFGCQLDIYSVCSKPLLGYFYEAKIWADQALTATQLAFEVMTSSSCTGGCTICASIDTQCFSQKSLIIVDLDLEQNVQTVQDTSGLLNHFTQGGSTTASIADGDPIRIPEQGMRFSALSYLKATTTINLPHGLLIEAWVRLDLNNVVNTGALQYIYKTTRNTNSMSIAIDYNLIKVKINNAEANYFINWKLNTNWRYIGVTFIRTSYDGESYTNLKVGTTQVKIFIDNSLVSTQLLQDHFSDDQTSTKSDYIGQNFQGVIKKFRIQASTLCNLATSSSVSTTCSAYGSTASCSICDKSSQVCFSSCGFNTLDNLCTACNWKCRSCFSNANTCTQCESSKFLIGVAPACNCAAGYLQVGSQCVACHSNCATCLDTTNQNCPVCSATAYLFAGKSCLADCPYGFAKDSTNNLCHFQTQKIIEPVNQLDYLNRNCDFDEYSTGSICSSCHSSCYTCKGGSITDCTSCDLGKYLYNNQCLTCDATGMVLGSSGDCVEKCGDGKNFGLFECDDGNSNDGDGCSSLCEIEQDWTCYGGSPTSADTCEISELLIESLVTTQENNIIITLSKPAYIVDELNTDDLEIIVMKYDGTYVSNFEAKFSNVQEQPTQTLFVQLSINEFLLGEERSSQVSVIYKKSGKIFDSRLNELSTYTEAFTTIGVNFPEMTQQEKDAIKGMGMLNNIIIILTIGITTFLSFKFFEYSLNVKFFWKYYAWVQLEFSNMIPNAFQQNFMDMNQIQQGSYTDNYQFIGFLIFQCIKKKLSYKLVQKVSNSYMFTVTTSLFMCCLMPFGQASFIEIQNVKKTLPFKLASVSSSFFMLATMFFFLYSITLTSISARNHYHNERFLVKYLSILKPFKPKSSCLLYYPLFCWKRFIQIIITALFIKTPVLQALVVGLLQIGFLIYVFITRPFQSTYNNVLSMLSQLFPFLISMYSLSFNGSKDDPEKAFSQGWGLIFLVSIYCFSYTAIAMIANVYHILDKFEFAQRYTQEIEDKIRMTILNIFYRPGAAKQANGEKESQMNQNSQRSSIQQSPIVEVEQLATVKQDQGFNLPTPTNQPLKLTNQFKGPLGINDHGKKMDHLFQSSNKSSNNRQQQQQMFPPIDSHRPQVDIQHLITPKNITDFNGLPKDEDLGEDLSDPDEKGVDLANENLMNGTSRSKKKTKKVKKKVKSKKKKAFGDSNQGGIKDDNKGEYILL